MRGELTIIIAWITLIAIFLTSIWSVIEGIKNRSRFLISERIKYYIISLFLSAIVTLLAIHSSSHMDIGLAVSVMIALTLILGNLMYYIREERLKNVLEMKFRLLKYLLFSIVLMILNLIITELIGI